MTFPAVPGTGSSCVPVVVALYRSMEWHGVERPGSFSASTVLLDIERRSYPSGHGITTMSCGVKNALVIILLWTGWNLRDDIPGKRTRQLVEH